MAVVEALALGDGDIEEAEFDARAQGVSFLYTWMTFGASARTSRLDAPDLLAAARTRA
jgi:hypothetical protein